MSSVRELIRHYGLRPKRSLGQNFLIDESYLDHIVAAAEVGREDLVVEIGPGLGGLTGRLAAQGSRVVAVELDDRLLSILQERFAQNERVRIVHGDILAAEIEQLLPTATLSYKVVANLPYYITSAVLRHILEAQHRPQLAVVLVQKEVAARICAQPGDMSLLAVGIQFYARPTIVRHVPAGAFYPRPQVDSSILRLDVLSQPAVQDVPAERFFEIVRAGFAQKRKQLANSLSRGLALPKEGIRAALDTAGVDGARRAETLALQEWRAVCLALEGANRDLE